MSDEEEQYTDDYASTTGEDAKADDAGDVPAFDGGGTGQGWAVHISDDPPAADCSQEALEPAESPRPLSPPLPSQQPSLADGIVPSDRPKAAAAAPGRRPSSADLPQTQASQDAEAHLSAVYGRPPASAPPSQLLYGSYGTSPRRCHPNGLPLRHSAGPLPGMPYVSDLTSRYPVRKAAPSRPEISLISGQLYVGGRLRQIITSHQTGLEQPQNSGTFFPDQPWTTRQQSFRSPYLGGSFLEQRRVEKERRALLAAAQQQPRYPAQSSWYATPKREDEGPYAVRAWGSNPRAEDPANGVDGKASGGNGNSRERARRASLERWLEEQAKPPPEPTAGSQAGSSSLNDPSLTYRQYGIFRTYGNEPAVQGSSSSLPHLPKGARRGGGYSGHARGHDPQRKRASSGARSSSPRRSSGSPGRAHVRPMGW